MLIALPSLQDCVVAYQLLNHLVVAGEKPRVSIEALQAVHSPLPERQSLSSSLWTVQSVRQLSLAREHPVLREVQCGSGLLCRVIHPFNASVAVVAVQNYFLPEDLVDCRSNNDNLAALKKDLLHLSRGYNPESETSLFHSLQLRKDVGYVTKMAILDGVIEDAVDGLEKALDTDRYAAFVSFRFMREAEEALISLDGAVVSGSVLKVSRPKDQQSRPSESALQRRVAFHQDQRMEGSPFSRGAREGLDTACETHVDKGQQEYVCVFHEEFPLQSMEALSGSTKAKLGVQPLETIPEQILKTPSKYTEAKLAPKVSRAIPVKDSIPVSGVSSRAGLGYTPLVDRCARMKWTT